MDDKHLPFKGVPKTFYSCPQCDFTCVAFPFLVNHLSHIQQVDLEEEAQSAACDLVGSPADGIAQFAPHRQTISLVPWLQDKERAGQRRYVLQLVCASNCKHLNAHIPRGAIHLGKVMWSVVRYMIIICSSLM